MPVLHTRNEVFESIELVVDELRIVFAHVNYDVGVKSCLVDLIDLDAISRLNLFQASAGHDFFVVPGAIPQHINFVIYEDHIGVPSVEHLGIL